MELLKFIKGVGETILGFFYELLTLDWSFANHEIVYSIIGLLLAFLLLKQLVIELFMLGPTVMKKGFGYLANQLTLGIGKGFSSLLKLPKRLVVGGGRFAKNKLLYPVGERIWQWLATLWYRLPIGRLQWNQKKSSSTNFHYFLNAYERWKFAWKERLEAVRARLWYQRRFR
ncbi:MAG: hypothetical protein AAGJ93_09250 [Bacteroidota bacterium]